MLTLDISEIPEKPGVYIFVGKNGKILYVGKAKSLKKRVQSYYNNQNKLDLKKTAMLNAAIDIKFIVTKNEVEAFLLEANLIKSEKPRYNVMLKDSKGYPYIKLTRETFPKLQYTRDTTDNKATYFGPFVDAYGLKGLLMDLQRIFPLRTCSNNRFNQKKLCLKYQIKECCGPCENKVTVEEYAILVKQVKEFFKGNVSSVKNELFKKMRVFVDKLQFEEAAGIRDRINTLNSLFTEQSVIYRGKKKTMDAFVFHTIKDIPGMTQLFIRAGRLIGVKTLFFDTLIDNDLMIGTIIQFYNNTRQFPDTLICYGEDKKIDKMLVVEALNKLGAKNLQIEENNNKYKSIIDFALNNAKAQTELYVNKILIDEKLLKRLAQYIHKQSIPQLIECIDISHISGSFTVGVSIAYDKNSFNKSLYRRYKIKTAFNDDCKSIYEVMHRKAEKILKEVEEPADLYIIDGGKGQLNAAAKAFKDLNIKNVSFISIAKGKSKNNTLALDEMYSSEDLFIYGRKNKLNLKKNDPLLLFIQRLRDEAHRFAISYSRQLLLKNIDDSPLRNIHGVGPKRLRIILEKFPDLYNNKEINEKDLITACNIPATVARNIITYLKEKTKNY